MKVRRETIVTILAALVIVAAIPFAILDTIETGRVYLFSQQFLEELPQRFTGPGRLRFILQPLLAILLGVRGGLADARAGAPPYLFGLLFHAGRRRELLRSGVAAINTLLAMGDHHGRRLSARLLPAGASRRSPGGRADSHLRPLRSVESPDDTTGTVAGEEWRVIATAPRFPGFLTESMKKGNAP